MKLFNNSILSKLFSVNKTHSVKNNSNKLKENQNHKTKDCRNLHDCLKQLEFISCLEMNLDKKKEENYSLNFLVELKKVKNHAALNTLQSIKYCKS